MAELAREVKELADQIDALYEQQQVDPASLPLVEKVIDALDVGAISSVTRVQGVNGKTEWQVNAWVKKAILLYFRLKRIEPMLNGQFFDKVPLKQNYQMGDRLVPYSSVRKGSYIGANVVIMAPAFVNIGAYIDEGSMVDSMVLVGSCARIGKRVHLSAGTILGGVLEPPQGAPVIIEDGAFIGGNSGIYEGCLIEANAVIGSGTIITSRTPVIDINTGEEYYGRVPENAVVVPGGRQKKVGNGEYFLQTPLIIKRRDPAVSAKLALEESLRSVT